MFGIGLYILSAQPSPPAPPEGVPENLTVTTDDDRTIDVAWDAVGGATTYDIRWQVNGGSWTTVSDVTSPYSLTDLPIGGATYSVQVRADAGDWSSSDTAATHVRPYGLAAEWNVPIATAVSRGDHPHESYFADRIFNGWLNPGWMNFFDRDYTFPVYLASDATGTATVDATFGNMDGLTVPWNPSWVIPAGSDAQVIIIDESTGEEWQGWQCAYSAGTLTCTRFNQITANDDGTGGAGDYRTKTSGFIESRGIGIQYLAMLIRPEEIEQGKIYHALPMPCTLPGYDLYASPATKGEQSPAADSGNTGIPEGTRIYLDKSEAEIDAFIATWHADVTAATEATMKIVLMAMAEYGWIITDYAGSNHIQFQHDASCDWTPYGLDEYTAGGKTWPRDAIDGLITDPSQIKCVLPPDDVLYHDEAGDTAPVAVVTPTITGTGEIGTDLEVADEGIFLGEHEVTTTRIWQIDDGGGFDDIPGETGASYTVQSGDEGFDIRVRYSATNSNGTTTADSTSIEAIGSWTQTDAFAGVTNGGWWKFYDWTTLKQTTGGATNVTSDNDPVQYAADQSGLGNNLTKPAYHNQMAAHANGSDPCIDNGGGNQTGLAAGFDIGVNTTDDFTVCVAAIPCTAATTALVATRPGTSVGWHLRVEVSGSDTTFLFQNMGTGGVSLTYTLVGNGSNPVQVTAIKDGLNLALRVNGVQRDTDTATGWTAGAVAFNVGSRASATTGVNHTAGIFDVVLVDKVLTGADLTGTEARQAALL